MRISEDRIRQIIREEMGRFSVDLGSFDRLPGVPGGPPPEQDAEPRGGGRDPIMALYYTRIEANTGGEGMGGNFERLLRTIIEERFDGVLSLRFGGGYDTYEGQDESIVREGEPYYDDVMDAIAVVGRRGDLEALVEAVEEELVADWGPAEPHPDHEIVPLSEPE